MKKVRMFPKPQKQDKKSDLAPGMTLVFCDKATGAAQFRATASAEFDLALERMASSLAMQCLANGHEPENFDVLVPANTMIVSQLMARTKQLLEEGRTVACPSDLSPRQREILRSIMNNRANKEIASKLNITVRTVKFHISTLLSKFGVENRIELARRAANLVPAGDGETPPNDEMAGAVGERSRSFALNAAINIAAKHRPMRMSGSTLSA